jgi:hypothetical protein
MSELPEENDQDLVDERGRNPTQQRMDEDGTEPVPVDEEWGEDEQ